MEANTKAAQTNVEFVTFVEHFFLRNCSYPVHDISFYDLFRVEEGLVVEHWDTTEAVPPESVWKNDNGKF